jgi:hypothetical protein
MQRIRKDSETLSNSGHSTISRIRRESDRFRNDVLTSDSASVIGHRNVPVQPVIREVIKNNTYINYLYFVLLY